MFLTGPVIDTLNMAKINLLRHLFLALMLYSAATAKEHLRIRRQAAESVTAAAPNASKVMASEEIKDKTEWPGAKETSTEINRTERPVENVETRNSGFDLPAASDLSSSLGSEEDSIYYDNAPVDCNPELVGFEIVTG